MHLGLCLYFELMASMACCVLYGSYPLKRLAVEVLGIIFILLKRECFDLFCFVSKLLLMKIWGVLSGCQLTFMMRFLVLVPFIFPPYKEEVHTY